MTWRINRRGAVLLLFGIEFIIIGLSQAFQVAGSSKVPAYSVAADTLGLSTWGFIWAACGVLGMVTAFRPTKRDDLGFYVLSAFAAIWGGMSVGSWLFYGAQRGWVVGTLWGVHAVLLLIVSGMDRADE